MKIARLFRVHNLLAKSYCDLFNSFYRTLSTNVGLIRLTVERLKKNNNNSITVFIFSHRAKLDKS